VKKLYKQKTSLEYANRRRWVEGYRKALGMKRQLESQGWTVERGALTPSQAEKTIKELEREGFETRTIPVTEYDGETGQLVAYKQKPGATPSQPKPTKKARPRTTKDPTVGFQKIFSCNEEPDGGVLMDPRRVAAVVPKNASPQQSSNLNIVKIVEESVQKAEQVRSLDYDKFLKIQKIGKTKKQPAKYVSFGGEWCYDIEFVKKAMRVLGTKKEAEAYYRKDQPLVVRHKQTGHSLIIAPSFQDPSDPMIVSISTVQAM
jgi:hypothetical protein